ncbi:MAG: lipoyl synthase [Victivallales bacterium]|nr:lipoyl synthase [Victivallales bacterium]
MSIDDGKTEKKERPRLPPWIRVKVGTGAGRGEVAGILKELNLNTVCGSAECPNLDECWRRRTATFMILGNHCTRNCRFCAVPHSDVPPQPDPNEPANIAEAVERLNLKYVVVTSVTRDDLPDGGSALFAETIRKIRSRIGDVKVEVLTPDYLGDDLQRILDALPTVFNHNVETVERLSKTIRVKADYRRSLRVLCEAANLADYSIGVKSGIMVGMGEMDEEVETTIRDIRGAGAGILTIGQYLPPSGSHWVLDRYVEPAKFAEWRNYALSIGFDAVASAPLVRSSYNAEELSGKSEA